MDAFLQKIPASGDLKRLAFKQSVGLVEGCAFAACPSARQSSTHRLDSFGEKNEFRISLCFIRKMWLPCYVPFSAPPPKWYIRTIWPSAWACLSRCPVEPQEEIGPRVQSAYRWPPGHVLECTLSFHCVAINTPRPRRSLYPHRFSPSLGPPATAKASAQIASLYFSCALR